MKIRMSHRFAVLSLTLFTACSPATLQNVADTLKSTDTKPQVVASAVASSLPSTPPTSAVASPPPVALPPPLPTAQPSTPLPSPTPSVAIQGLVGHYPFDGNANDESGNGNNGQAKGATLTADRFNQANKAYALDGTGQHIQIPNSPLFNTANVTLSLWVKPASNTTKGIILHKQNQRNTCYSQFVMGHDEKNSAYFELDDVINCDQLYASATTVLSQNTWYHLVGLYDGTYIKFYVNGKLEGTKPKSTPIETGTGPLFVGVTSNMVRDFGFFNGAIDDLRVYNRALSEAEVQVLYSESNR